MLQWCQVEVPITFPYIPLETNPGFIYHPWPRVGACRLCLGVLLDSKLNFNMHFDTVAKKANSTRAFLSRRIGHCGHKIKKTRYKTFIRPIVEYAATSSYTTQYQKDWASTEKLCKVCHRCLWSPHQCDSHDSRSPMAHHSLATRRLQSGWR